MNDALLGESLDPYVIPEFTNVWGTSNATSLGSKDTFARVVVEGENRRFYLGHLVTVTTQNYGVVFGPICDLIPRDDKSFFIDIKVKGQHPVYEEPVTYEEPSQEVTREFWNKVASRLQEV